MSMRAALVAAAAAAVVAGCGDTDQDRGANPAPTTVERITRVEVLKDAGPGRAFDPEAIYARDAPGVVTVFSVFDQADGRRSGEGVGSGFVIGANGEIVTNAHVVTDGTGKNLRNADDVFIQFGDRNQVPAEIVGTDPNSDIALLRVQRGGLTLRPLTLGSSSDISVGAPVAAIGSPYGEPQSLSIGVISAVDRTIESLTGFSISGAIQTDAAINQGNSGGPLVDARSRVVGVNSQIRSTGGGGEGVGYAVPVDTVRMVVDALRRDGKVPYAFLGVETAEVYPQLAKRFGLGTPSGAWVQGLTTGGPADDAGLRAGSDRKRFQASAYDVGGDVITGLDGQTIRGPDDLGRALQRVRPGQEIKVIVIRDGDRMVLDLRAGERPAENT